jgi:hypothetical protein
MIYRNHDDYPEYPGFDDDSLDFALEPIPERPLNFNADGYAGHRRHEERQWRAALKKK